MKKSDPTFLYKDNSKKIKNWPFWGQDIGFIFGAGTIQKADEAFKKAYPQHCDKKGNLSSTITVKII